MSLRVNRGFQRSVHAAGRPISRRTLIQGSAVAVAALALPAIPAWAAGDGALVRYVNVVDAAPDFDLYIDGERVVDGLAFGKATKPARQPGGTVELAVVPAGEDLIQAVLATSLELDEETRYVIPIFGRSPAISAHAFPVLVQALEPDTARLRILHLAHDLDPIDFGVTGGPMIAGNVLPGEAAEYADIESGTVNLEVRVTGTSDVLLNRDATEIEAGRVYDLLIYGRAADDDLHTLLLTATAEDAADEQSSAAPDAGEMAYLTTLKENVALLHQTLLNLDDVFPLLILDPNTPLNDLAWVFVGWVVVHREVDAAQAPPRYEELKSAYLAVLEPLASTARQMAAVDDYLSGAADTVDMAGLNTDVLFQVRLESLHPLEVADQLLRAALDEAGLPALEFTSSP